MPINCSPTMQKLIPLRLAQVFLQFAMDARFPEHRESIQLHLSNFVDVSIRYGSTPLNTKSLQNYFVNDRGWSEFKAAWYRAQIDKILAPHQSSRQKQSTQRKS